VLRLIDQIGLAFLAADFGIRIMPIFKLLVTELFPWPFAIKAAYRLFVEAKFFSALRASYRPRTCRPSL
jgi:hypothetical protein